MLFVPSAFAADSAGSASGRTVRIGITDGENEQNRNFQEAYFKALAQYAGWDCEFVSQSWDECISGLKSGDIELLSDVSITEERSAYMDFSAQPMGTEICYMYGPNTTALAYDDFQAFNGIRVG